MATSFIFLMLNAVVFGCKRTQLRSWLRPDEDGNRRAIVGAMGDILLNSEIQIQAFQSSLGHRDLWKHIAPLMKGPHISYANLEGPVAPGVCLKGDPVTIAEVWNTTTCYRCGDNRADHYFDGRVKTGFPKFNYNPSLAASLKIDGLDILSLANNHVIDRCEAGILATVKILDLVRIQYAGARQNVGSNFYTTTVVNDISIAWISCNEAGRYTAKLIAKSNLVLSCTDSQKILNMVAQLEETSDIVIVLPHWGTEFLDPTDDMKARAVAWLEAGATAVLGNHAHVTQEIVEYVTKNGRKTVIIYSIGNFISHQGYPPHYVNEPFYPRLRTSPFLLLHFVKSSKQEAVLDSVKWVPLYVKRTEADVCDGCRCPAPLGDDIPTNLQACAKYHVMPADNSNSSIAQESIQILESYLGKENYLSYDEALNWLNNI